MKVLAVIPARAGSKGVPGKNKRTLLGKPLILYTMEAATHSKRITKIVVSSNDEGVLELAREQGIEAQARPEELATDGAPMVPVLEHVVRACHAEDYDVLVLLQATSPFRTAQHIDEALALLEKHPHADGVLAVERITHPHPNKFKKVGEDGYLADFMLPEDEHMNRQDFIPAFVRNGAIFAVRMKHFLKEKTIKRGLMLPYEMSAHDSVDINEPMDFVIAEAIMKERQHK